MDESSSLVNQVMTCHKASHWVSWLKSWLTSHNWWPIGLLVWRNVFYITWLNDNTFSFNMGYFKAVKNRNFFGKGYKSPNDWSHLVLHYKKMPVWWLVTRVMTDLSMHYRRQLASIILCLHSGNGRKTFTSWHTCLLQEKISVTT